MNSARSARWRWLAAALVSIGLVGWLIWRISLERLIEAAWALNWPALAFLTAGLVVAVFAWDVVCVRWLYSLPARDLGLGTAAEARAGSYVWSAFNYEAGQAMLAWELARIQNTSLLSSLSRCVLLAIHDLGLLLALGLFGALIDPTRESRLVPAILAGSLAVLASLIVIWRFLPTRRRQRIIDTRWGNWLAWWQWRHSAILCVLRLVYFGIMIVYAGAALRLCGIDRDYQVIGGVVPLVLLADALPSISGFGTRHAALESLLDLNSSEQAVVFHFSTIWSAGLMLGRAGIGLGQWWLVPLLKGARESS